jgi:hypothetical protein
MKEKWGKKILTNLIKNEKIQESVKISLIKYVGNSEYSELKKFNCNLILKNKRKIAKESASTSYKLQDTGCLNNYLKFLKKYNLYGWNNYYYKRYKKLSKQ